MYKWEGSLYKWEVQIKKASYERSLFSKFLFAIFQNLSHRRDTCNTVFITPLRVDIRSNQGDV